MDLNYLLSRHQVSLMSADATDSLEARCAHLGLAACYALQIREYQRAAGAEATLCGAF